ncbi:MAG: hypothetical protein J6P07_04275 [Spirochaetaceae bacterium]|nr:hypothetical protein [Spirochaetaceae bacterium]MBO7732314.1 hypothetical protein [Methanobrevibacter sp.]
MITLLKCLGIIIGGLIISKILMGIANIFSEKQNKKVEEYYKNLEYKRKAELYDLLKEAERDAEIEAKLDKIKQEYNQNNSD